MSMGATTVKKQAAFDTRSKNKQGLPRMNMKPVVDHRVS